jgi:chromosome segregation protein
VFLKSIIVKGFKSFPERTRLEFGPGVSVIVGPNGSGKSNVTDAVLWALGEQSPAAVRGQSMQDVIFAGAPGRQASSAAEVELVLDDSEGVLGLGSSEVSIVRRLDRTGEGEYRLAGARCRLIDVIEVLSDTGLGKEMHSVISQGRVESIVTSKPRDRRLLIEEAAGLGKHRKRRRRAQLKLLRTQDNLDRALDVEREARTRLRPLKRQAEAAELHARLERQSLEARWELTREDLRAGLVALAQAEGKAAEARVTRDRLEAALDAVSARRECAEEALAGRSAQREELSRRCFVSQSAAEGVTYRADATHAAAEAIEHRIQRTRRQLEVLSAGSAPNTAVEDGATDRITQLEAELAELEVEREQRLAAQVSQLEQQLERARAALAVPEAALQDARTRRQRAEQRVEQAGVELRHAERAVEAARREAARVGGELAAVNQFLRSQAGRPGGASVLAEQLEVDPGYELAVAAALDGRLRAAVVADHAAACDVLDQAGPEGGRALITGTASEPSPPTVGPNDQAEPLIDHVRGPRSALELARTLLSDTWVVDSLEAVPSRFRGVAVTRAGRVWSAWAREVRQAPAAGEDRILAQRNRREELIRASERAAQSELAAGAALAQAAEAYQSSEAEREDAIVAYRGAQRERDEAAEQQRRVESMIERRRSEPDEGPAEERRRRAQRELAAERERLARIERERVERQALRERLGEALARDEQLLAITRSIVETLVGAAAAIAEHHVVFEAALAADREAGEHLSEQLRACAQEEAAIQTQLHGAAQTVTETEVAFLRARDRAGELEHELQTVATRLELDAMPADAELSAEQREALLGRIERLARRREQLGPVNPLAQQEYADALEHVEELERQREDLETALRELQKLIADTDKQIRETFEETFAAAARNFEQVVAQLFPGGRGRLRLVKDADGQARVLGGVPVADDAPEPDESAAEVEDTAEGEGEAEEDLLGVEIEINPAGKEMKRLTLLSGGEKSMTALAFLFAVFLARPCPFYILDEVEAALDDLNIDRFLALLRSYSQQAQFIVVTHQRRTMEAADILYGVSMGSDGVSKVISQRLAPAAQAAA